jgi:NitT/TauT family transport system substrate-binding protein
MLAPLALAALAFLAGTPAIAADQIKIAVAQKGFWDSVAVHFADVNGFFKAENLDVSYSWTQGGAETVQAVATGSVDAAIATGFLGVVAAYAKDMPVRVMSTHATGVPDVFWYVKSGSPIRSLKDFAGKSVAFSRPGGTSQVVLLSAIAGLSPQPKLVSTGGLPATRTQLMTDQVDVAWSVPPFNLDLVRKGEARIVFRGAEVAELQDQTIRVNIAATKMFKERRDVLVRLMRAYNRTIDWMYEKPQESAAAYAKFAEIEVADAAETMKFYPRQMFALAPVRGIDSIMRQAVEGKFIDKPLTSGQLADMIDIVYDPKK